MKHIIQQIKLRFGYSPNQLAVEEIDHVQRQVSNLESLAEHHERLAAMYRRGVANIRGNVNPVDSNVITGAAA